MDCPYVLLVQDADFDYAGTGGLIIKNPLEYILVPELPLTVILTVAKRLLAYPEDFGRTFEITIQVVNEDGGDLALGFRNRNTTGKRFATPTSHRYYTSPSRCDLLKYRGL